jgi:hypothetical protein
MGPEVQKYDIYCKHSIALRLEYFVAVVAYWYIHLWLLEMVRYTTFIGPFALY